MNKPFPKGSEYQYRNGILIRKECVLMNGKRFSQEKTRRNGFYLALAVCLVAVGIAAWSTYDAVNSYVEPVENQELIDQQEEDVREGQETDADVEVATEDQDSEGENSSSSQTEASSAQSQFNDDPEAPRDTSAQETAGEVTQGQTDEETEEEASADESSTSESSEVQQVPATAPLYEISTEMIWPIEDGQVLNAYSAGTPVYSPTMKDWRIHTGLDVQAESESPVLACANGQVLETYTDNMLGNVALIEHGDYLFYYCGLGENFQVEPGEIVTMGQQIGVVTAVPFEAAEEPHLHVEVRRDGATLDPQAVIDGTE